MGHSIKGSQLSQSPLPSVNEVSVTRTDLAVETDRTPSVLKLVHGICFMLSQM